MAIVSIIIPSRNEIFLNKTVEDLLSKASGDIEIIAILDGYWPDPPLVDDKRLIQLHRGSAMGMRAAINSAAEIASGAFLMKSDAHCLFSDGYDEVLKQNCADNWIVIPSRYSLDYQDWKIAETGRARVDYHFLTCPMTDPSGYGMHGQVWNERARKRRDPKYNIDDEMSFQGSCWFMSKKHWKRLGGMSEIGYGTFSQEAQEIGNKTWLMGGEVKVNKNAYYAHLHKGKVFGRGYKLSGGEVSSGVTYSANYWLRNEWGERKFDFEWLIEKFWPVPSWPENWRELVK